MKLKIVAGILFAVVLAVIIPYLAQPVCAYESKAYGSCRRAVAAGSEYCVEHTCCENGCNALTIKGAGTRCNECEKKVVYYCKYNGCTEKVSKLKKYCKAHTCQATGCNKGVKTGSIYCSSHTCNTPNCHRIANKGRYCTYCSNGFEASNNSSSKKSSTKSNTKSSTKSSYSSKKKYQMPDCDDYEDYDDFMDDWDGCMPDGSDAEDYWENW